MPKKKSRTSADLDPIERLIIQQQESERSVRDRTILPYSGAKYDVQKDYQGPQNYRGSYFGSGTLDRMPGASGYTYTTPNPVEFLLDKLRIRQFNPQRKDLTPTKRPNPMPGII